MHGYSSVRVTDLASTPTGRALWEFIGSEETFVRLETATLLERPAIEGVADLIKQRFDIDASDPHWMPVIAAMVRQVMTARGYSVVPRGEHFRDIDLFVQPISDTDDLAAATSH